MKKNPWQRILFLALFSALLLLVMGITAFATTVGHEPVTITGEIVNEDGSVTTEYGVIPADLADAEAHPFVLFDTTTKEVIKTFSLLNGEGDTYAFFYMFTTVTSPSQKVALLMRRDYQQPDQKVNYRSGEISSSEVIFDLGGHKLTLTSRLLIFVGRDAAHCTFTMKNGSVSIGGQAFLRLGNESYSKNKLLNLNFENIDFLNITNHSFVKDDGNANSACITNVNFKNCIFRLGKSYQEDLFSLGKNSCVVNINVNVYGGLFHFPGTEVKLFSANGVENKTLTFHPYNGAYPQMLYGGESIDMDIPTAFGTARYYEEGTTNTFRLYMPTEYGLIPEAYFDTEAHPIVLFDVDTKAIIKTFTLLSGDNENYAFYYATNTIQDRTKNLAILLRKDNYKQPDTKVNWNAGQISVKSLVLDLDGKNVILNSRFLVMVGRSAYASTLTIKDGTINVGNQPVLRLGFAYGKDKNLTINFNNINFTNLNANQFLYDDGTADQPGIANINYNDCTFHLNANFQEPLFSLGKKGSSTVVNVNVNGGAFYLATNQINLYSTNAVAGKTVNFNQNANGEYPTIQVASTVDASTFSATNNEGKLLGLRKVATEGANITYAISPLAISSVYLNLTNNLNFVYRVFLPTGYTAPKATFTVGGDTVTVEDYTIDENGLYCFRLTAIAPHKMGDCVTATVSAIYNNAEETIQNDKVSVKNYAESLRQTYAEDTALLALLDNLLVYGATSQVYMNYNTDALVAEIGELASLPEAPITMAGETSVIANISACGLLLDGAFDLRVGIKATSLDDLTLEITKGDVTTVVNLISAEAQGEYIVVYYDGLDIDELDTEVTFTLKQNGNTIGKVLTFSANAYLYRMQSSESTTLANLAKALYAYGTSAKAYNA